MRRTYRKNILRTVRASLSRFLAIFAIVALGVGFLSGLLASLSICAFQRMIIAAR